MNRGSVWWAEIPGVGRRPVVVLSAPLVSTLLAPVVARITARQRPRSLPTFVELLPGEAGLSRRSFVLAHELHTLHRSRFDEDPVGELPVDRLVEIERALSYGLDL